MHPQHNGTTLEELDAAASKVQEVFGLDTDTLETKSLLDLYRIIKDIENNDLPRPLHGPLALMQPEESASPETRALLNLRGAEYGEAWILTSAAHKLIMKAQPGGDSLLVEYNLLYAWLTILSKLIRAMRSPRKRDHWADIVGWGQLVLDRLAAEEQAGHAG